MPRNSDVATSMAEVKDRIQEYGAQIKDYLLNMNAEIEGYRFSVEKIPDGLAIDVQFRANLRNKR
jgi:glucan biosynthesis protein